MKKYLGILLAAFFGLIFRVLVEFHLLEINSWTFLIVIPIIMGYIPFVFQRQEMLNSTTKTILFPIASVAFFLLIAFITHLEDLGCFILLFPPFCFISMIVSLIIRQLLKGNNSENDSSHMTKNGFILVAIPILLGNVEMNATKNSSTHIVSEKVIIHAPKTIIWHNLFSVPDLTNYMENSTFTYLGFPNPVSSQYNATTHTRLGHFSNGIILNENVIVEKPFEKLTFHIDVEKSDLASSPTFQHVLENKNVQFANITYHLREINANTSELSLSCQYTVKSNIPFYGEFWANKIIQDFEQKLLSALKKRHEIR